MTKKQRAVTVQQAARDGSLSTLCYWRSGIPGISVCPIYFLLISYNMLRYVYNTTSIEDRHGLVNR